MYKIIGGDGQEYGPISDADILQWIAEGRLNGQSLAKAESDTTFRPLSTFPEFAAALGITAPGQGASSSFVSEADWSNRDYQLDIGGCLSRGWELFKNNAGVLLGSTALYFVIIIAVSMALGLVLNMMLMAAFSKDAMQTAPFKIGFDFLFRAVSALAFGPLAGGIYYIFIRTIRGQVTGVGDLFAGFPKAFAQLFLGYLVFILLLGLCLAPYNFIEAARMAPLLVQMQQGLPPDQLRPVMMQLWGIFVDSMPILFVSMLPAIYILTSIQFSLPLIIDREMDFWSSIKWSWKMTHKHWFTVFGLVFIMGLINLVGFCLCCVGLLFTFAITTAACMYAYETIFGAPEAKE